MPETEDEPSSSTAKTAINGGSPAEGQEERTNVLFGKYEMGRLLGCGGFAKVYHARDTRTGKSVAVKVVSKQKVEKKNLQAHVKREVSIMSRLRHPHIIRLLEVLATRTKIYFIMEYAKGGELFAKVAKGRFSEDLSRRYFHQLISAVGYCHSRGVYHRDLKPENILLDENWSLKVSDFGLSAVKEQIRSDGMLHTSCGTPAYVAPEIIAKKGYDGAKVDIWSCGVILYVLNAGFLPFNDSNMMNMYRKIYRGEFRCPKWMSPELRRFIGRLLDINPNTRITVDEIIQDPWFNKGYKEVKFKWYDENYEFFGDKAGGGEDNERRYLTAFDLITFSPGFSLSGLFGVEQGRCQETYLSKEVPETVVEKVEDEARRIEAPPRIMVERVKGGMGVRIEGQNGNFGVIVMVHRLTEELAVVEVRMREKDVGPSVDFWKDKLRPRISHLFFQPGRSGSLPGPSQHLNPD